LVIPTKRSEPWDYFVVRLVCLDLAAILGGLKREDGDGKASAGAERGAGTMPSLHRSGAEILLSLSHSTLPAFRA
jgi:hypothetical protein